MERKHGLIHETANSLAEAMGVCREAVMMEWKWIKGSKERK